jgi:outer membrane protein OmpA-like peptidoglycan-associated protein
MAPPLDDTDSGISRVSDPLPIQRPLFRFRWQRGELALSGHTRSLAHEDHLVEIAGSRYPQAQLDADFLPLGVVPAHWADSTTHVLNLLAETSSADATMSTSDLTVRAVIDDELRWQSQLEKIRTVFPPGIAIKTDVILVDRNVSVSTICARAFAAFNSGPINFEESTVEFRSSAYPRLDRAIGLAKACANSHVSITGHTDASGDKSWNQHLSLKRANAVADYIAKGGVVRDRLRISGVGSSVPIADNETRYGRSMNRRIEISFTVRD